MARDSLSLPSVTKTVGWRLPLSPDFGQPCNPVRVGTLNVMRSLGTKESKIIVIGQSVYIA